MYFPLTETSSEPPERRRRVEEECMEERLLKDRLCNSWPRLVFSTSDRKTPTVSAKSLWSMLFDHDRAHEHCRTERWTVRSRLGAHNRFALCVNFHSVAVISDADPPKEDSPLTHVGVVNWSIIDHEKKKRYRFCFADDRAPALFSMLIANKSIHKESALLQAMLEQFNQERLVLPDQLLDEGASMRLTELDVQFGSNTLKSTATAVNGKHNLFIPTYTLHLEGVSCEGEKEDLSNEARAVVDLTFMPRSTPPVLDGVRGIISNGCWEDDEFSYGLHHTRVLGGSIRITRASDHLELAREMDIVRGSVSMEHSFGGVLPRSAEEARFMRTLRYSRVTERAQSVMHDHCFIRLYDEEAETFSITRIQHKGASGVVRCFAAVESAVSKEAFQHHSDVVLSDETDESYRSSETGVVYPTRWVVECPTHDGCRVELRLVATLANQEVTTFLAQPSMWEGTVTVTGMRIKADGSVTEVQGDGFVVCRGRVSPDAEDPVFSMLRGIGSAAMNKEEVAVCDSWEEIAEGPGVKALAALRSALQIHEFELTPPQQVVLAAFLGTYGYIFHHPQAMEQVKRALQWCYNQWTTFYGASAISYRTLTLRAFVMRELCELVHAKCGDWVQKRAQALDIAVPVTYLFNADVADSCIFSLPARNLLLQPPSVLEVAQMKALIAGTWKMDADETEGSMNAVLLEQGVDILRRILYSKAVPTWFIDVNRETNKLIIEEVTMLERCCTVIVLDGTEWVWESVPRGCMKSRSCILSGGCELYVETEVQEGMERAWYQFKDGGKTMVQNVFFFSNHTTSKPVASCRRYFKIQIPHLLPAS